jgi:DNA-binding response OmpR family regulator
VKDATRWHPERGAHRDGRAAAATVLLVDDEAAPRRLFRQALERRGLAVLEAGDGAEALRRVVSHPGAIDLLATDVDLPQLDGCELARQLRLMRPGLRVLYLSGLGEDCLADHGGGVGGAAFLQKPFGAADLAAKVRELLDAPA